jgi:hypothetical protein
MCLCRVLCLEEIKSKSPWLVVIAANLVETSVTPLTKRFEEFRCSPLGMIFAHLSVWFGPSKWGEGSSCGE